MKQKKIDPSIQKQDAEAVATQSSERAKYRYAFD